jgi:hypothetical protein
MRKWHREVYGPALLKICARQTLRYGILLSAVILLISGCSNDDMVAVEANFNAYKTALINNQGSEAAKLITSRSISYYESIREQALEASEAEVRSLSLPDKILVLSTRHRIASAKLLEMNGAELFAYGTEEGWTDISRMEKSEIDNISVQDDRAIGYIVFDGQQTDVPYYYIKEDGIWKFALWVQAQSSEEVLEEGIKYLGVTEDEYLMMLLELTGRKPATNIWEPLI